ncbi:MAG: polyphosphate polymerase domain-containing protein [Suipraeoptans sp.]
MRYEGHMLRHELKYYINERVYLDLRARLKTVLRPDENMVNEQGYLISSLYFDDIYNSSEDEKKSGIKTRKKYRIRACNRSKNLIKLECKRKFGEYISKESMTLTADGYNRIMSNDYDFLLASGNQVGHEVFCHNRTRLLKPKVVVEYLREAYVLREGNVRITFDKDISGSVTNLDMFDENFSTYRVIDNNVMVLEVKYDAYLPSYVYAMLQTAMTDKCAISKYVICKEGQRRTRGI